jgi:periplasmic protein TonB
MFSTLESTWHQSGRRGWTTLASFTMQALGMSLLLAIPLIWVQRPPLVRWLQISAPTAFTPPAEAQHARGHHATTTVGTPNRERIITPPSIPRQIAAVNDTDSVAPAPDLPAISSGQGPGVGFPGGLGNISVAIPAHPPVVKPLLVSVLAEANIIYQVQPIYPPLARHAHVQGAVELRAIISKAGTIENLVVVRGHPMLATSAIEAVRQWRYRPYLLNHEPIEVETEITVNFVLSGR